MACVVVVVDSEGGDEEVGFGGRRKLTCGIPEAWRGGKRRLGG